ncbi:MAG: glucosaminidase domain-containing protein [Syntrophomonadaceae bacterium]
MGKEFISEVMKKAVNIQLQHNLPAAAITAQACLETGYGEKVCTDIHTGQYSYNLFNIKGEGPAGSVLVIDTEYHRGVKKRVLARFRAYHDFDESYDDYVRLMSQERYAPCRAAGGDPDEYARQLYACGYAADPNYARDLIKIMDMYGLREMAEELLVV